MSDFKPYRFHSTLWMVRQITFKDNDGVSYSDNPEGLPYIMTTLGKEFFEPGDYLLKTPDGDIVRLFRKKDFEPYAKEVTIESETTGTDDGRTVGGDVHGEGNAGDGGGDVRLPAGKVEVVGRVEDGRRRRAAQRRAGNHERDAGRPHR